MEGLILSGSVAQDNIFGTGKFVNLMVNTGRVNKTYSLSYTDPYFTKDGITAGFDIYKRVLNTSSLTAVNVFNTDTMGVGLRFGIPLNENDSIQTGLGIENTQDRARAQQSATEYRLRERVRQQYHKRSGNCELAARRARQRYLDHVGHLPSAHLPRWACPRAI